MQKLRGLADQAAASGLKIAIYPHFGEWTARFGDATKLADAVDRPNFGVSFNLCHCLATGDEQNIPHLLTAAKRHLFIVQINGADSGVSGKQWNRLIQTLDKGTFDVESFCRSCEDWFRRPHRFSRLCHRRRRPYDPRADDDRLAELSK